MVEVGRVSQLDMLFTDQPPPPAFDALLAEAGITVSIGGTGAEDTA
jgi:DeoR family glycerol-3-phosphate regulon repressor